MALDFYIGDDLIDRAFVEIDPTAGQTGSPQSYFDISRFDTLIAALPPLADSVLAPLPPGPPITANPELIYFQTADVTDQDGEVISFTEGPADFIHPVNGRRYRGGLFAELTAVAINTDLSPTELTITFNGLQAELALLTRYSDYQYAEVKIWLIALNQRTRELKGEWLRYRGFISHAEFRQDEDNKTVTITFHLTTRISDPDRQYVPRISPAYQKDIDPGDTAFDKLAEQSRKEITWGRGEVRGYPQSEKNY